MTRAGTREFRPGDVVKHHLGQKALLLEIVPGTDGYGNTVNYLKCLWENPQTKIQKIVKWESSNFYVWAPGNEEE